MRVLQVSKFYPPVMGGIESVAWELAEGLNRAGVPTDVLCSNQRPRTERKVEPAGYTVTRAGSWGRLLSTSVSPAMIAEMLSLSERYDIVHAHMPDPMAAAALWFAQPRGRVVVHWHSDVIRQRFALKLYEPLQHWLLNRADAIIATSQPYADASGTLRRWRRKVAVVPIGISDNRSAVSSERAALLRQRFRGRRIVFALGRMTYYKGFDVLIEAAASLPDDSVVLIGGDGEMLEHFRSMVLNRGLVEKVHLLGRVGDDELASHFEACDVFCMPSTVRAEAYGVAMVEAMMMSKPIVASDIPGSGVPWVNVNRETGFNVPVGQPRELAKALTDLLENAPLREVMSNASRRRYLQDFNAELMTRRTMALYHGLWERRL